MIAKIRFPYLFVTLALLAGISRAEAQGTLFSYQGQLTANGAPANGLYDIRTGLYATNTGGGLLTDLYTNLAVPVSNGLFIITMDFGSGVFTGTPYWLQIGVRTNGIGATFTPLSPRQELTPNPYAIYATSAGSVSLISDTGTENFFAGQAAGNATLTGIEDTGVGFGALFVNTSGSYNTAQGVGALSANTTGSYNTADGAGALFLNVGGADNTAIGFDALVSNTNGNNNTATGTDALFYNTSGSQNTADGAGALFFNTTGGNNTAVGYQALLYNTNQGENTAIGSQALYYNTTGSQNTGLGYQALLNNQSGTYNTASGAFALNVNSTGFYDTASGGQALEYNTTGAYNEANGFQALWQNTTGSENTADGSLALLSNESGSGNIALGFEAGYNILTGSDNIDIGNVGSSGDDGVIRIGTPGIQTETIIAGTTVGINATSPSQALEVNGYYALIDGGGAYNGDGAIEAYIGGNGGGSDVQIGSMNSKILNIGFWNTAANAYMHIFCSSITINGGADLAEPFQVSSPSGEIPQGSVVVIDKEHPGHLKVSSQAYDTRVAGVLSGANGINPGIQMQQQSLLEGGKNVALTGRVYVLADAANGAIEPGDLLTTSDTPGHAMKVSDHARASGAILGKAMTGLQQGKGMVLVLVTLQ